MVSGAANNVETWAAFNIGFVGSIVHSSVSLILIRFNIDDPLEGVAVHGACGLWGIIAVGIFDHENGLFYSDAK